MLITKLWMGLLIAVFIAACSSMSQQSMADKSLYERLGGKKAITAVVDDFVGRVAADKRINGFFAGANVPRLKMTLVDQICEATGGPCKYTGRDMKSTHQGMGITNADFDALVGDLVASLDKFKVGQREKQELLAALSPMRKNIVQNQ